MSFPGQPSNRPKLQPHLMIGASDVQQRVRVRISNQMSATTIVALIDELRRDEASSVEILSDNREFNGHKNCAVVCCGAWTNYELSRYEADTLVEVLNLAAIDMRAWAALQKDKANIAAARKGQDHGA